MEPEKKDHNLAEQANEEHEQAVEKAAVPATDGHKHDAALDILAGQRVVITDEQSQYIRKKVDKHILPILMWVYFLQILDKACIGYGATFGMIEQTGLVGTQYSTVSSSGFWAQLALCAGPTMFMIVKVPTNILMSTCTFCWGVSMIGLAFSKSFGPLLANRFLLGLFEAVNIPLFTVVTITWYRRAEQPLRIGLWYGTNGVASILGSLLAWGLSFTNNPHLHVYQILFLTVGLATVLTAPLIYWFLDNNPAVAKFLTPEERLWAVERLRSNGTGVETKEIKWSQVIEAVTSPILLVYFLLAFCINTGSSISGTFGPLIIKGFGFDSRTTLLVNMPFGFMQMMCCVLGCYAAAKWGRKGIVFSAFLIPCLVGSGLLYGLGREKKDEGPLLFGYYLLAFLFGGNPLIFSWIGANTAGHTKKSLSISLCNAASAVGNIVGPLLFKVADAPAYRPGISGVLGLFIAAVVLSAAQIAQLVFMNKRKEKQRVRNGKPAKIQNSSMNTRYEADIQVDDQGRTLGEQNFLDLTDKQNDEFLYTF